MLRKTRIALLTLAAVGLASPAIAAAYDGGFEGSFHRGNVGDNFSDEVAEVYGYPDADSDSSYHHTGCYLAQKRVHTARGWRLRPVEVCD